MVSNKFFIAMMCLIAASGYAFANSDFKPDRGRYWGEIPKSEAENKAEKEQDKKPQYTMPYVPPMAELMKWHPKDIRKLFTKVHEFHVMAPTLETARAVQEIKAVMNKKARAAAAVEQLAILNNPTQTGVAENAVNPSARSLQRQDKNATITSRIQSERQNYALIMLTQPGCSACQLQRNVLANFSDLFGWKIKEVNIIENPQASARFGVQVTPTTLIASRVNGQWQTVAIGSETLPAIENNIHQAIRLLSGEIRPDQWLTAPTQEKSLYDPNFN